MKHRNPIKIASLLLLALPLAGCFGGMKRLRVVDYTDQRVTDLSLTKKVTGSNEFLFFSTTKMGLFLDGNIQGLVTDYKGNPIEGVTVKVVPDLGPAAAGGGGGGLGDMGGDAMALQENANSSINLSFAPGITDTQGLYKIHFSLPVNDNIVDVRGKLVYNPGWEQEKKNLGKAYEPQIKQSPFRLYYNLDTGFLAFAEGVRAVIVEPIGSGKGAMDSLPGATAPQQAPSAAPANAGGNQAEQDLFKGFNFGQ